MALLLSDQPLHFCFSFVSFIFHSSLTYFLIFLSQMNLSLNLFPLKPLQFPFILQCIIFLKPPSPSFPISVFGVTIPTASQAKNFAITLSSHSFISSWSSRLVANWITFHNFLSNTSFGSDSKHQYHEIMQQPLYTSFYQVSSIPQANFHTTTTTTTTRIIFLKYESDWITPLLKLWLCIVYGLKAKALGVALVTNCPSVQLPTAQPSCCHIELLTVSCSFHMENSCLSFNTAYVSLLLMHSNMLDAPCSVCLEHFVYIPILTFIMLL